MFVRRKLFKEKSFMKNSEILSVLKNTTCPIFIYGGGELAVLSQRYLKKHHIEITGFVLDDEYSSNQVEFCKKSELEKRFDDYILIKGILGTFMEKDDSVKARFKGCSHVFSLSEIHDTEKFNKDYLLSHENEFNEVLSNLEDEESKKSLIAYLKAKSEEDSSCIVPTVIPTQYFFYDSPWKLYKNETLLDGGAFNGDSIRDFLKVVKNKYKAIYACEPDNKNMNALKKYSEESNIKGMHFVNKGLGERIGEVCFSSSGTMLSHIVDNSDCKIQIDTIDNILNNQEVSIIKMDIEGSEMDALRGGIKSIEKYLPILMISAYHKKDDILQIYNFAKKISSDYKFFFRNHKPLAIDSVLYCVPMKRL